VLPTRTARVAPRSTLTAEHDPAASGTPGSMRWPRGGFAGLNASVTAHQGGSGRERPGPTAGAAPPSSLLTVGSASSGCGTRGSSGGRISTSSAAVAGGGSSLGGEVPPSMPWGYPGRRPEPQRPANIGRPAHARRRTGRAPDVGSTVRALRPRFPMAPDRSTRPNGHVCRWRTGFRRPGMEQAGADRYDGRSLS